MTKNHPIKRRLTTAAFVGITSLGASQFAAGQAACPPGMIPYGTGSGISSCGPASTQNQETDSSVRTPDVPIGRSRWGAVATDAQAGILGVSGELFTRSMAVNSALEDCKAKGGKTCKLEVAYDNECAAVVVGSDSYNVTADPTLKGAINSGMETCRSAGSTGCHTYYSACSLPVR